jgi:hypothetical protein
MVTAGVLVLPWSGDVIKTHHTKNSDPQGATHPSASPVTAIKWLTFVTSKLPFFGVHPRDFKRTFEVLISGIFQG